MRKMAVEAVVRDVVLSSACLWKNVGILSELGICLIFIIVICYEICSTATSVLHVCCVYDFWAQLWWGWWRWALISLDGVAPSWMVSVSASVNLALHHKVQKFSSGTGSPGWSRQKGRKTVVMWYAFSVTWSDMAFDECDGVNSMPVLTRKHSEFKPLPRGDSAT